MVPALQEEGRVAVLEKLRWWEVKQQHKEFAFLVVGPQFRLLNHDSNMVDNLGGCLVHVGKKHTHLSHFRADKLPKKFLHRGLRGKAGEFVHHQLVCLLNDEVGHSGSICIKNLFSSGQTGKLGRKVMNQSRRSSVAQQLVGTLGCITAKSKDSAI